MERRAAERAEIGRSISAAITSAPKRAFSSALRGIACAVGSRVEANAPLIFSASCAASGSTSAGESWPKISGNAADRGCYHRHAGAKRLQHDVGHCLGT